MRARSVCLGATGARVLCVQHFVTASNASQLCTQSASRAHIAQRRATRARCGGGTTSRPHAVAPVRYSQHQLLARVQSTVGLSSIATFLWTAPTLAFARETSTSASERTILLLVQGKTRCSVTPSVADRAFDIASGVSVPLVRPARETYHETSTRYFGLPGPHHLHRPRPPSHGGIWFVWLQSSNSACRNATSSFSPTPAALISHNS
eukprot:COSAG01_NODE_2666_length_7293_cov_6.078592_5_plen_207_part_00